MIPKVIHYCWFGKNEKNKLIKKCIASWNKVLPGYDIIEWNEDNFDIQSNLYVSQAYEAKKWAFVSDYVRLYALFNYGGIYLDSDVEVFRPFDQFLTCKAFTGFEYFYGRTNPITAVMGTQKNHSCIEALLKEYDGVPFEMNGEIDLTPNTVRISNFFKKNYGVKNNDKHQIVGDDIHIYPSSFFCRDTGHSFSVHHMDGSWNHPLKRKISKIIRANKLLYKLYSLKYILKKIYSLVCRGIS